VRIASEQAQAPVQRRDFLADGNSSEKQVAAAPFSRFPQNHYASIANKKRNRTSMVNFRGSERV
jgi:hypothetical protein